ncbi:MAG: hypothetical protein R3F07_11675 [Opitutaceae bacterium]
MKLPRRRCSRWWALAVALTAAGGLHAAGITYIGRTTDRTDFHAAPQMGVLGYWFPHFNAPEPVMDRPTDELERNGLPVWAGPLVHLDSWMSIRFFRRTFSQDGPCRSAGGFAAFNRFTLPDGEVGLSGIILDPHAAGNTSNAVNRIMLGEGTPASFYLRIVVDNTGGKYNAISRLRARGVHQGNAVEPDTWPQPGEEGFNGVADIYTFRFDGFVAGDFIKIQLAGMPGDVAIGGGASMGGILFDPAP